MSRLGEALIVVNAQTTGALAAFGTLGKAFSNLQRSTNSLNAALAQTGKQLLITGTAITATFGGIATKGLKAFGEIEYALRGVAGVITLSNQQWQRLEKNIEKAAATTIYAQKDMAESLMRVVTAGFDTEEAINAVMKNALALGGALRIELNDAIGLIVSGMNVFKKDLSSIIPLEGKAAKVANTLAAAQGAAALDSEVLAALFRVMGSDLERFDLKIEDVVATLGTIKVSMGEGRRATMALQAALQYLAELPIREEFQTKIIPALKKVGLTAKDINPSIVGVGRAFQNIVAAGLTRSAEAARWFGVYGVKAIQIVGDAQNKQYERVLKNLGKQRAALDRAEQNVDNVMGTWKMFAHDITLLWKRLGEAMDAAGFLERFKAFRTILAEIAKWLEKNKELVGKFLMGMIRFGTTLMGIGVGLLILNRFLTALRGLFTFKGLLGVTAVALALGWLRAHRNLLAEIRALTKDIIDALAHGDIAGAWKTADTWLQEHLNKYEKVKKVLGDITEAAKFYAGKIFGVEKPLTKPEMEKQASYLQGQQEILMRDRARIQSDIAESQRQIAAARYMTAEQLSQKPGQTAAQSGYVQYFQREIAAATKLLAANQREEAWLTARHARLKKTYEVRTPEEEAAILAGRGKGGTAATNPIILFIENVLDHLEKLWKKVEGIYKSIAGFAKRVEDEITPIWKDLKAAWEAEGWGGVAKAFGKAIETALSKVFGAAWEQFLAKHPILRFLVKVGGLPEAGGKWLAEKTFPTLPRERLAGPNRIDLAALAGPNRIDLAALTGGGGVGQRAGLRSWETGGSEMPPPLLKQLLRGIKIIITTDSKYLKATSKDATVEMLTEGQLVKE